jgi:hypothetical protein
MGRTFNGWAQAAQAQQAAADGQAKATAQAFSYRNRQMGKGTNASLHRVWKPPVQVHHV